MIRFKLALFIGLLAYVTGYSQSFRDCITDSMFDQFILENPAVIKERIELEAFTKDYENQYYKKAVNVKIIPIVFHIIHDYGSENISKEHVLEGLNIINEDFRKLKITSKDFKLASLTNTSTNFSKKTSISSLFIIMEGDTIK